MHYYEVLPLKKTGSESRTFTYRSKEGLKTGSLVQIPLKNRTVRGLIFSDVQKPEYATREIAKTLSSKPILTDHQIAIAKKISEHYFCSLGEVINTFLPFDFGKKRRAIMKNEKQKAKSGQSIEPNKEQQEIIDKITCAEPGSIHLIHGVTGSGKTEIYLRLAEAALRHNRGSIILVPEIALTPQTKSRFEERFGEKVAVWHSGLKETEKYHAWNEIKSGDKLIALGARSAIFAPIKDLEYIFIDEEHEQSYKQDQNPRYDARLVAEWLATISGAKLILGSATPRLETFHRFKDSAHNFYTLEKRIVQNQMPPVQIVDLRDEFRKGNKSIVSDDLLECMRQTLERKKQVMLLVNRRGAATFVTCRDCGYVEACPNCELPLTYHPSEGQTLKCHHCDFRRSTPTLCPECQSAAIRYFGLGTQRTELELQKLFPKARIVRMDRDSTQKRGAHEEIYEGFKDEKFDILIGTQMIAKGWDLPNVELVGVISADTMLNLPDFRSTERAFSLLTQVAGRTGRGYHPGKVIFQTYNPESFAIIAASKHDYNQLYQQEIASRNKYHYPPFTNLIKLTYSHPDPQKASEEAKRVHQGISTIKDITILGPAPAFIEKIAGKFRYQLLIKIPTKKDSSLRPEILSALQENVKSGWTIDIDPENLL